MIKTSQKKMKLKKAKFIHKIFSGKLSEEENTRQKSWRDRRARLLGSNNNDANNNRDSIGASSDQTMSSNESENQDSLIDQHRPSARIDKPPEEELEITPKPRIR